MLMAAIKRHRAQFYITSPWVRAIHTEYIRITMCVGARGGQTEAGQEQTPSEREGVIVFVCVCVCVCGGGGLRTPLLSHSNIQLKHLA